MVEPVTNHGDQIQTRPARNVRRLTRRRLSVAAGGALVAPGLAAIGRAQDTLPGIGLVTPEAATPLASPIADGAGTPIAAATPVAATPVPDPLVVIREQNMAYEGPPVQGGELRLLRPPAAIDNFNPVAFRQDFQVFASYLDPLLRADPLTLEPTPGLATGWSVSPAGTSIELTLRDDVLWHDGTPFTAADVVFTLLAYRDDPDSGVWNLLLTTLDVTAPADNQVVVSLATPDPAWLFNVGTLLIFQAAQYAPAWDAAAPGDRALPAALPADGTLMGTGPWRFEAATADQVAFVRNEDYWQSPPWCERLTLTWNDDPRERVEVWVDGATDLTWPVRVEDIALARGTPGRLNVVNAASVMFMAFNFDNPTGLPRFFDPLELRLALEEAIDREQLGQKVFGGFADMTATGTIAQPWARDPAVTARRFDRQSARRRLAAQGWTDLNADGMLESVAGVPFDLTVIVASDARRELLQAVRQVKADWAAIGVLLRIQQLDPDDFRARVETTHDFDLVAYAYDLYPGFTDFDLYGSAWNHRFVPQGWNPGAYFNVEADTAIAAYLAATTVAAQQAALSTLQRVVNDDLFGIWLGFPSQLVLVASDIDGFVPNLAWPTLDTRLLWRTVSGNS